jgi:dienelactone hydrolase
MNVNWHSGNPLEATRTTRTRFARAAILGAVVSVLIAAPLSAQVVSSRQTTPVPSFSVGITRCTFVDPSRGVLNYRKTPYRVLATSRTLVTEIRYPTALVANGPPEIPGATPVTQSGGYPMVVFAHGYDVTPDTYAALLDAWASAGFVVVAPLFPDEDAASVAAQGGANTEDDVINEPGDLAFVTRSVLQDTASPTPSCPVLDGLVNPAEIALAGHSDGAEAVSMLAYDHGLDPQAVNYADLRNGLSYRAVVILSGALDTYQSNADEASKPNLLVVHSLADTCDPVRNDVLLYNTIHQPNKWFLELKTAHHLPPFDGVDAAAFKVVIAVTIPFLQSALEGESLATPLTTLGSEDPSVGQTFTGTLGSSLVNAPQLREHCGLN